MTERLAFAFTPRARAHAVGIEHWWRAHRPAAPDLFQQELDHAIELVTTTPTIGSSSTDQTLRDARRLLLPRTRYHFYYRVRDDTVEILAIWHAMRRPPRLR